MKNQTLNNAFPIVAAALGNKFGVKVKVGGEDAFTDGKSINLPAYNLEDPSYKDVAWGYLAHEAAHVRFTEFEAFAKAATSPIRKIIVNILEDTRIEKLMQETYPGTKRTIEKVVEHLIQTAGFEITGHDQEVHPATILGQFLLFRLRCDVLGQTALSFYANLSESLLEETFPAGAVTRLAGLLSEVPQLQVTRDCVRLADRILRMIEEEQEKEQEISRQLQQQPPSQQGCDDSSLQPQSGQSDADQDLSADSKPDNPDQDQSQGQSSQQSDADGDEQDQQPGQGGSNVTGSTTDHSQSQNSEQLVQTLASVLSAGEDDVPDDLFEVVQQILGSHPHHCYDADVHMPLPMDPNRNPSMGNALLTRVLTESGKIRASLQGLVQSSRCECPVTKRSGNRIDGRKLSRLVQGDSRVFVRRHHVKAPNTAIHLLVDSSGSMNNLYDQNSRHRLIDIAMESGMALALALEGISGVNPAVTRFPLGDTDNVVPLLKHGQKVRPNAPAFSAITSGGTPLHTALWYAAASVLATREKRKVIMVLTDGQPDDERAAKAIIHRCEATGIELVGVGICYDTSHLFDRSICINNVSELRSELFRTSRDLLLAA
jgi:cobaltochelatase CobT